jgi:hypothetical protein
LRATLAALLLIATACAPKASRAIAFDLPAGDAAPASMLAMSHRGTLISILAFDATDPNPELAVESPLPVDATLLQYGETLEDLLTDRGTLSPDPNGRELPLPDRPVLGATLDGSASPEWKMRASVPAEIAAFRTTAVHDPCVPLTARRVNIAAFPTDPSERYLGATLLSDGHVLMGTERGRLIIASATASAVLDWAIEIPSVTLVADGPRAAWGFDERGDAERVDLERKEVTRAPLRPGPESKFRVHASESGPFEALVGLPSLAVLHFDGLTWTELVPPTNTATMGLAAAAAWVGPGEFVFVSGRNGLARYKDGQVTTEATDLPGGLSEIFFIPGYGLLLLGQTGVLYHEAGGVLTTLPPPPVANGTNAALPLARGFLFGGRDGFVVSFDPIYGFCPAQKINERFMLGLGLFGGARVYIDAWDTSYPTINLVYVTATSPR